MPSVLEIWRQKQNEGLRDEVREKSFLGNNFFSPHSPIYTLLSQRLLNEKKKAEAEAILSHMHDIRAIVRERSSSSLGASSRRESLPPPYEEESSPAPVESIKRPQRKAPRPPPG